MRELMFTKGQTSLVDGDSLRSWRPSSPAQRTGSRRGAADERDAQFIREHGVTAVKLLTAWLELTLTAAALLVATLLVMWAQAPTADCVMPFEAARRLVLDREVDREHLARDLASADRVVQRYEAAFSRAGDPPVPSMVCEDTLFQTIAARHGLAAERVRLSARERAGQI
jgi:hypothetical protein